MAAFLVVDILSVLMLTVHNRPGKEGVTGKHPIATRHAAALRSAAVYRRRTVTTNANDV